MSKLIAALALPATLNVRDICDCYDTPRNIQDVTIGRAQTRPNMVGLHPSLIHVLTVDAMNDSLIPSPCTPRSPERRGHRSPRGTAAPL